MPAPADPTARDAALRALHSAPGRLTVGGLAAEDLAEEFGTPLYVHSATALRERIASVRDAFGPTRLLYALKANPLAALVRVAGQNGAGFEIASDGEIHIATTVRNALGSDSGIFPEIQFAGPGKSGHELQMAIEHEVVLNVESEQELSRLTRMAKATTAHPTIQLRVNPMRQTSGARLRMADASSRFGIDRDRIAGLVEQVRREDVLDLRGLHVYGGSQTFAAASWLESVADLCALAEEIETHTGQALGSLNFGGGFGWPVYDGDPDFDLATAKEGFKSATASSGRAHTIELGRYLCAGGGVYLTRVVDTKRSGGHRHAVLDGGLHQCAAASGFGASLRRAYAVVHAHDTAPLHPQTISIGGPLCTPADRLGRDLRLAPLEVGDTVAILNVGAYGLTFSPTGFLGHAAPAEIVVEDGQAFVARARGRLEDALRGQVLGR